MRSEPCSAAWRLTALLLGASWVVTLAVACGGGGDDAIAGSVAATSATGGAGSGAPAESAAVPAATSQSQVLGHHAAALSATLLQPCVDDSRRPAHLAAVPEHLAGVPPHQRAPVLRDELSDEVLSSRSGRPNAAAAGSEPPEELIEAK